jgi:hypothetical protein
MGFQKFRLGHAGAAHAANHKRASSSCLKGGFYTSPTFGSTIDSLQPLNITWDTSCLSPSENLVDIYLYASAATSTRLHVWENVNYTSGHYEATLMPRWWNSTSSEQLQLVIIQSGDAPFLQTLPSGPVFTATYSTPSTGTPASAQTSLANTDSGITDVRQDISSSSSSSSHLSGGKIAAAVIMPILAVAALFAFLYIKRSRDKGKAQRKQWSEKVDQRMSVVSADWQSVTAAGAQAAIRNSMAIRASMAMEADARLSMSQTDMGVNLAGMGVQAPGGGVGGFFIPGQGDPNVNPIVSMPVPVLPETAQPAHLRPGLRSSAYSNAAAAARVSRVSFAAEPTIPGRASGESRRSIYDRERPSFDSTGAGTRRSAYSQYSQTSRGSRAFHYTDGDMPPLPEGAAERASQFYMLNHNANISGTIGSGVGVGMRHSHMNVSSVSLGSESQAASRMSRLSRFDEVYGDSYDPQVASYSYSSSPEPAHSHSQSNSPDLSAQSPERMMSPTQTQGPLALSTEDIKRRISMRQGSKKSMDIGSGKRSFDNEYAEKSSFDYDVGPALSMIRAQEQEDYFGQNPIAATSETLFTASPSPQQTTFPSFPMPSLAGAALPESPIQGTTEFPSVSAPVTSSYTGMAPPKNEMNPDDMLKAYAERKAAASPVPKRIGTPKLSNPSPLGKASISFEESEDGLGGHAV